MGTSAYLDNVKFFRNITAKGICDPKYFESIYTNDFNELFNVTLKLFTYDDCATTMPVDGLLSSFSST